jgi:predicted ATPase
MIETVWDKGRLSRLQPTNWWIVTGGPSCGKTALLGCIAKRGFKVISEAARDFIDEQIAQGKTIEDIRRDEMEFQNSLLDLKVQREEDIPNDELVFWDRGLHGDSMAYQLQAIKNLPKTTEEQVDIIGTEKNVVVKKRYQGVFLLDPLPNYQSDYARTESQQQALEIHKLIDFSYSVFGYSPIRVPVLTPVEKRAEWVLNYIKNNS